MNFFCRLFGHTWVPHTTAPEPRWNTTKDGVVLVSSGTEGAVRHFERCQRCSAERESASRAAAPSAAAKSNAAAARSAG
jgi:hypothetical protein